jgi:peroxidase
MSMFTRRNPLAFSTSTRKPFRRDRLRPAVEQLEDRVQPSTTSMGPIDIRPIDEMGNNAANVKLGTAGTQLIRISPVAYADGIGSPSLPNNPSARVISDILNSQADPNDPTQDLSTLNGNSLTDFGYTWGQFIDHDMDLTPGNSADPLTILADPNDPSQMGDQTFNRSVFASGTGITSPRQQINAVTSFLDLSQVYGSTDLIAHALRAPSGGLLKTSPGNMLPYNNLTYFTSDQLALFNMANDPGFAAPTDLFVTGDVRGNENIELTALQTLFVRNHNRLAVLLKQAHSGWGDEQLYQEARKLNIAQYQSIIYNAYLPDLLGPSAMRAYAGYNAAVNPSIATEFSTVAFRFGHSLLDSDIERHTNNGLDYTGDPAGASIPLASDFFDPYLLNPNGVYDKFSGYTSTDIGLILKGNADAIAQADDLMAVNDVRNLLFGNGGATDNGLDLMARDVERARDHGIGTYNQVRVAYGLPAVTSFTQITGDATIQEKLNATKLQAAYGTVDNIDPFEGGLAEVHVNGSDVGPLFTRILVDQFTRLRAGDRFFYLNESFNQEEATIFGKGNTLAEIIQANTNVTNLQRDVFVFKASISGSVSATFSGKQFGLPGIKVQVQDDSGAVVAVTVTDRLGQYSFNMTKTGDYSVSLVLPSYLTPTPPSPTVLVSRGDASVRGVNFTVTLHGWGDLTAIPPATDWAFANTQPGDVPVNV